MVPLTVLVRLKFSLPAKVKSTSVLKVAMPLKVAVEEKVAAPLIETAPVPVVREPVPEIVKESLLPVVMVPEEESRVKPPPPPEERVTAPAPV